MSPPVFHLPAAAEVLIGEQCVLDGAEGRHASVVRRVRSGEHLVLTDGCGVRAEVAVTSVERGRVLCRVLTVQSVERAAPFVTVVQAIPKGDRGELAVDLLTEVGVDQIVPWQAERCVSRWQGAKVERGRAKWAGTAREAAKQSRRIWWPVVEPVAETAKVIDYAREAEMCLVLHEAATEGLTQVIAAVLPPATGRVLIVVGPEGGISPAELSELERVGGTAVRLGPTVLRTSTAGVVAATLVLGASPAWGRRLGRQPEGSIGDNER
ncbi:MAG: 16S rRNA (uracil(1498)-N(3))-methyltransferase [Actinomycetes bacterium]